MLALYHRPFCPHSRYVRLAMAEAGLTFSLYDVKWGGKNAAFLKLSPEGTTPALIVDGRLGVPGEDVIVAYLEEAHAEKLQQNRLLPRDIAGRVEARRLTRWFNQKMHHDCVRWILREKIERRFLSEAEGGGAPDMAVVRAARDNLRYHVDTIGRLAAERNWLAGDALSYADLAAAAQLSCVDYLGDAPWNGNESAMSWYARIKSRPSFRPLLAEKLAGLTPSATYANLDF